MHYIIKLNILIGLYVEDKVIAGEKEMH